MKLVAFHPGTVSQAEVFPAVEQLLDRLEEESSHSLSLSEQREDRRHAVQAPVMLGVRAGAGAIGEDARDPSFIRLHKGWATDVSTTGMGALVEHELLTGVQMYVDLEQLAGRSLLLPVRIAYCKQLLANTWRTGLVFVTA